MRDSSVSPVGLFDLNRGRRLLHGLVDRFQTSMQTHDEVQSRYAQDDVVLESELESKQSQVTDDCRQQRRQMLEQWDSAEEQLVSRYEANVVSQRTELNRLAAKYRGTLRDETQEIERKCQLRVDAIEKDFEAHEDQPGQQQRKELLRIERAIEPLRADLKKARELTFRRLDRLPEVEPLQGDVATQDAIDDAIEQIRTLGDEVRATLGRLRSGIAARTIESSRIPLLTLGLALAWAAVAFFVAPAPPWMWMAAGIVPAAAIGLTLFLGLIWPLKNATRKIYPEIEHLGQRAEHCVTGGRKIADSIAANALQGLVQQRDHKTEAARQWQSEQIDALVQRLSERERQERESLEESLSTINERYQQSYESVHDEMRLKADSLAEQISQTLSHTAAALQRRREATASERDAQLQLLRDRLSDGVQRGFDRILQTCRDVEQRFPSWEQLARGADSSKEIIDYLPLGWLRIDRLFREQIDVNGRNNGGTRRSNSAQVNSIVDALLERQLPDRLPIAMHRRRCSGVVIRAAENQRDQAVSLAHQLLWRLLTGAPPSRARLTLIDPLGRGQNFTGFMALADHDPAIVGHRVWTTGATIEARLAELAHHVEDVLQSSLRDRFERIEDYNVVAGSMAEPYRAIAAVGMPEGLSREGYRHLRAIMESGLRCGIFTVLVCDDSRDWPAEMPRPDGDKVITLRVDQAGAWWVCSPELDEYPFEPALPPAALLRTELVEQVGSAAVSASRVEIALESLMSDDYDASGSTADQINILIGSQGANRSLALQLGEGVKQHVLIAGKTGSGKSTLLHSIITSGALHYRPDQLQFYLLDFKKGVEFKPYADLNLPHARVIGIESEREFGRSVLQRLDAELQHRGEQFRAAAAQELAEYREKTGDSMPRIMLVVDEFQELFVRDDRLAADCAMLLDRLVRQGRSFGMHVVLSSQSLAGAYSLPRATLGQMAVRIAMQCSESDAALILSDDNTAARLISRPGEAIYNNAGGLVEGNQPFQVAWLDSTQHESMLRSIETRDRDVLANQPPTVVFEGNRPCRWSPALADAIVDVEANRLRGLLGESVEIGPPAMVELAPETGRNLLVIAPPASRTPALASMITTVAKTRPGLQVVYLDGARADAGESLAPWFTQTGINVRCAKPRDAEAELARVGEIVKERGEDGHDESPILLVIDPIERFRDLRPDDAFKFSLDSSADQHQRGADALKAILRDGPACNVFVILVCGSADILSRWLARESQHDLELRILGQMNASDSSLLIDTPAASELSPAAMLLYDDATGQTTKFRHCDLPDPTDVANWLSGAKPGV